VLLAAGLEFPPVSHLLQWPDLIPTINKPILINFVAVIIPLVLFALAIKNKELVPTGVKNLMESSLEFIEESVIAQTIGPDGMKYLPFLASLFFFILFGNIFEVIPLIQFPSNARMAMPAFLALLVWVVYIAVGIQHQGPKYFLNVINPPGVPKALLPLVSLIELVSTFIVRPFSLAVRLFANMLAGHLLLVTFAVLTATVISGGALIVIAPLPFVVLIGLIGFEILVAFLQAFIFTILTAVYIGGSMHPEH